MNTPQPLQLTDRDKGDQCVMDRECHQMASFPTEDQLSVMEQAYDQFQIDGGE